jgi:tetratricopeptide (TPR) repeat protein
LASLLRGDPAWELPPPQAIPGLNREATTDHAPDPLIALVQALVALQQSDTASAQSLLSAEAVNIAPTADALRHYYLGVLVARQGQVAQAGAEWQQAQVRGLQTPWLASNLAALHMQQAVAEFNAERWAEAAQAAREVLQVDAHSPQALAIEVAALDRLAHAAAGRNDWPAAISHWGEARTLHAASKSKTPPHAILQNLALAHEAQEQWEQAGTLWRELLRSKPRSKKAQSEYSAAQWEWIRKRTSEVFKQADRPDATIDFQKAAVKSDPDNIPKRLELADALLANEQFIAARNQLNSARKIDPAHIPTLVKLAEYHSVRNEWAAAEEMIRAALEHQPQNDDLRQRMAQLLQQHGSRMHGIGRHAEARRAYAEAQTFTPSNPDLEISLARVELDAGHDKAARAHMDKAIALDPRRADTYAQIVLSWCIERKLGDARTVLKQAEAQTHPDVRFYVSAGLPLLAILARPSLDGFSLFGPPRKPAKRLPDPLEDFVIELLDKAVALRPDNVELLQSIVSEASQLSLPKIGLHFIEPLRRLMPDDLKILVIYGILQRYDEQTAEAKKTIGEAVRQARARGDREVEQIATQLRREIDSPIFTTMFSLHSLFEAGDDDFDDIDFADDDDLGGFFAPPPRSRRRR